MFRFLRRGDNPSRPEPNLDSLRFDAGGLHPTGEPVPGGLRTWSTVEGDAVSLRFTPFPPNLPVVGQLSELERLFATSLDSYGASLEELALVQVDGLDALRLLTSRRLAQEGEVFVGSITVPFRAFSYVLKIECRRREGLCDPRLRALAWLSGVVASMRLDEALRERNGAALPATSAVASP